MGVDFKVISPDLARAFGVKEVRSEVIIVTRVYDQGPAVKTGVELDDIILEFNGAPVTLDKELASMVEETPVGSKVKLKIVRGGQSKEITVLIGETPTKD